VSFEIDVNSGGELRKTKLVQWDHRWKQRFTEKDQLIWRKDNWNIDRK